MLAAASTLDWASGTASMRIGSTAFLTSDLTTTRLLASTTIAHRIGATDRFWVFSGSARLANNHPLNWRDQLDTADVAGLSVNAANQLVIGWSANPAATLVYSGTGTTIQMLPAGTLVALWRDSQLEMASGKYVDFASEIDVRQDAAYIGSASGRVVIQTNINLQLLGGVLDWGSGEVNIQRATVTRLDTTSTATPSSAQSANRLVRSAAYRSCSSG